MTLYTDIEMEPIPIHCDAAVNEFRISPTLPDGMNLNATTGTISGRLANYNNENIVYTVTATTNGFGSTETTFTFRARSQIEMNARGAIGCYWKTITECKVPDFDFFYKNPAQLCQTVNELYFTDNNVDNTWPGLDRRFVDYYSAYFYTYLLIPREGVYEFALSSDDGAIFYLDDLTTPFISRESCRALSETSGSKTLTEGRHLIVIRFFEYNQWSSMYLKYGSTELELTSDYIDSEFMRVGGRGPTFISYDFIAGYVNTDLPYYMPQLSSGAPVSWSISPDLPQGMTIDVNGYISGRPSVASSGVYTVTATGVNGIASTEVSIVISSTMNTGFRTKFYTITDTDNMCSYNMLTGNAIRLSQISIMDTINYPEVDEAVVWSGFPSDFSSNFYMEWEGYLRMDSIGRWRLRLTCDDGCKLIAADEQPIITFWGCHYFRSQEATYAVSKIGYYYFRVEYQQKSSTKGIVFEWQAPGGIWEVVPQSKVFYLPTGILSYRHEQTHYYTGSPIEENQPVFFSVSSLNTYRIFPDLPSGLSLSTQTGRISGTPTNPQIMTKYTVTANNGASTVETVISFDVLDVVAPTGLSYSYEGNTINVATTVTLIPLRAMSSITIVNSQGVTVNMYTVTPSLPSGLSLNAATGAITGTPTHSSSSTMYTITATNSAGFTTLIISLAVAGCKGETNGVAWTGEFLHVWFRSGEGTVSVVTTGSTTIQSCSVDTMKSDGNAETMSCTASLQAASESQTSLPTMATFCVNPTLAASYQFRVTCNTNNGCRWQVTKDDGTYYPYRYAYTDTGYAPYYDTMAFPTTSTTLSQLTLSMSTLTAYSGNLIETVEVDLNGCYNAITISPTFGSVSVDLGYPMLTGIASGSGTQIYTISATGPAGSASATLTVTYGECSAAAGQRLVTFLKTTNEYGTEESWELRQGSTVLYQSGLLSSYLYYYATFCLTPGDYIIVLQDSYGDGWVSGGYITATDEDGNQLGTWTYSHSGSTSYKEQLENWTLTSVVQTTEWKYLVNGRPSRGWNSIDGDRSSWGTITFGNVGDWVQNGVYFVHEFELTDGDLYPIVEFGVYYRDGIIVYLNGEEVYRRNMGSGTASYTTAASGSFDGYLIRVGTAAGYLLTTGKNVLAVELHRANGVNGALQWNGYVSYSAGDCVERSTGGTIRESNFYDKEGETAAEAWDDDSSTQWTENGLPAWTVYSYDFDHVEWINRMSVGSSIDDASRDPAKFTVYGSNDGVSWDKLYSYEKDEMFESRAQTKRFMMMDHMNSYGQYKFEVSRSKSGVAQISVSKLALEACRLIYCPKDGDYPGTASGTTVTIDCPDGYIGERYRSCSDDLLKPSWGSPDESECRSKQPSKGTSYLDVVYAIAPISLNSMQTGGSEAVASVLSSYLGVNSKNVEAWKVKDVTDTYENDNMANMEKTAVWVRVTVSDDIASTVLTQLSTSVSQLTSDLTTYYTSTFSPETVISFYREPELSQYKGRDRVSGGLIVLLVVVVLIVVAIASFYIWTRLKNKSKKNGAKRLARSGTKASKTSKTSKNGKKDSARV